MVPHPSASLGHLYFRGGELEYSLRFTKPVKAPDRRSPSAACVPRLNPQLRAMPRLSCRIRLRLGGYSNTPQLVARNAHAVWCRRPVRCAWAPVISCVCATPVPRNVQAARLCALGALFITYSCTSAVSHSVPSPSPHSQYVRDSTSSACGPEFRRPSDRGTFVTWAYCLSPHLKTLERYFVPGSSDLL